MIYFAFWKNCATMPSNIGNQLHNRWGYPLKKFRSTRIDAPRSRQPLVIGERLVRIELSAAMTHSVCIVHLLQ